MVKMCCVKGCRSESYLDCGISFHRFPKDEKLKAKWLEAIGGKVTCKEPFVCSNHFKREDYRTNTVIARLNVDAVPCLEDPADDHLQSFYEAENDKEEETVVKTEETIAVKVEPDEYTEEEEFEILIIEPDEFTEEEEFDVVKAEKTVVVKPEEILVVKAEPDEFTEEEEFDVVKAEKTVVVKPEEILVVKAEPDEFTEEEEFDVVKADKTVVVKPEEILVVKAEPGEFTEEEDDLLEKLEKKRLREEEATQTELKKHKVDNINVIPIEKRVDIPIENIRIKIRSSTSGCDKNVMVKIQNENSGRFKTQLLTQKPDLNQLEFLRFLDAKMQQLSDQKRKELRDKIIKMVLQESDLEE